VIISVILLGARHNAILVRVPVTITCPMQALTINGESGPEEALKEGVT